ncbi:hypothetical protein HPB51_013025 [Rhipicephalus microplus]|uniref:Uncharacterized protein n=1 Tax=Rhipicephalus microplus TaxID=6941 RepID=A0A9J6F2T9_RHIMP|nr:hypothetical protein HPB51_013025 [Rhipicephalus microplus]
MGVRTAIQIFSPPVTAALSFLKDQAGHTCDTKFANVAPTVEFMTNMYRWFVLMDVSNCEQHIHQNNPDTRQFSDAEDPRLHWLELVFLEYIEMLKEASSPENFLTKETYHALVFTTVSNVQCIQFLLNECDFTFVLTRKFSSNPIESLFRFLRRTAGCNDVMDVRSAVSGLEKILKTGIVASSDRSNVNSSTSFCSSRAVSGSEVRGSTAAVCANAKRAQQVLREVCLSSKPFLPTPDMAATPLVGGYIARVVSERNASVSSQANDCLEYTYEAGLLIFVARVEASHLSFQVALRVVCVWCSSMVPNRWCHYNAAYKTKVVLATESSSNIQAGQDFGVDKNMCNTGALQRGTTA